MAASAADKPRVSRYRLALPARIAIAAGGAAALGCLAAVGAVLALPEAGRPGTTLLLGFMLFQAVLVTATILHVGRSTVILPLRWLERRLSDPSAEVTDMSLPRGSATELVALKEALAERDQAMQENLRDQRLRAERFRDFAEASGDVLWESDAEQRLVFLGGYGIVASRRHPSAFMNRPRWEIALDSHDRAKWTPHRADVEAHRPFRDLRYPVPTADGQIWLRVSGVPCFDADGGFLGYRGVTTEITEQANQERELARLSNRLSLAVSATRIGIYDINLETGRVDWNDIMEELYGIPPGSFANTYQAWQAFIHPDDLNRFATQIRDSIAQRQGLATRTRIRRPDGKVRVMQFSTGVLPNAKGKVTRLVGINRDVTEEHEAQERQAALSQRLTLATEAAGIGIFELDVRTLKVDWDDRMAAIYGLELEQFDGTLRTWRRYIDREDVARLDAAYQQHRYKREPHAITLRITRADGTRRILQEYALIRHDEEGEPERIIGVNWDITEEQQSQAALRRLTKRLTLTTRTAGIGFCDFEDADGSAVWDETLRRIHGVPDDLPPTKANWLAVLEPADRLRAEAFIRERYVTREPGSIEYRIRRSDGAVRDIALHIAPDLDPSGRVARLLGAGWDITEEREAQRQLRHARDTAREANLAKDRFLATMSHELRTPLNAILGFSEVIRDQAMGPLGTLAYREYAEDIHRSGQHLLSLVNDLIDTARVQSAAVRLNEEDCTLAELLGRVPPLLGWEGYRQIVPDSLLNLRLTCDPRLLSQVLVNLISNARKHSPADTPVLVGGGCIAGGALSLWVTDEGPGIAADEQRHVLEPFGRMARTEEAAIPGVGLGLAIARSFVQAHDGQLFLHSAPGLGTTVGMILPPTRLAWTFPPAGRGTVPALTAEWPAGPCLGCLNHEAGRIVRGGDADGLLLEHGANCILTGSSGDACAHWGEQVLRAVNGPAALAEHAMGAQAFATCTLPVDGQVHDCLVEVRRGARTPARAFVTPLTIAVQALRP